MEKGLRAPRAMITADFSKVVLLPSFMGRRKRTPNTHTTIRAGLASSSKESYDSILQTPNLSDLTYRRIKVSMLLVHTVHI